MSNHGSNDLSASLSFKASTLFLEKHTTSLTAGTRMRGVTRLGAVALGLALGLGVFSAAADGPVSGLYDQSARVASTTNLDATSATITPSSFNAASNQCVIYAVLLYDSSSSRQLETGLLGCNNQSLERGACQSGYAFSESFDGANYHCGQGSAFTTGSANNALVERSSGTTTMWGSTDGSYASQSGFGATDTIQGIAWGEATSGLTCPSSPHSAAFTYWQKFTNAGGWSYVTSAPPGYHYAFPTSPCWAIGSLSSTGGFNAS